MGTSLCAPTRYERCSEYGNPRLGAERGRNIELALRWADAHSEATATTWRNRVHNLIDLGAAGPYGCDASVGHAQYEGITLAGRRRWMGVALQASAIDQVPRNLDLDRQLRGRSRLLATLGADGQWAGGAGAWPHVPVAGASTTPPMPSAWWV